jgi:hypothetical protein
MERLVRRRARVDPLAAHTINYVKHASQRLVIF